VPEKYSLQWIHGCCATTVIGAERKCRSRQNQRHIYSEEQARVQIPFFDSREKVVMRARCGGCCGGLSDTPIPCTPGNASICGPSCCDSGLIWRVGLPPSPKSDIEVMIIQVKATILTCSQVRDKISSNLKPKMGICRHQCPPGPA
jgi:hypothetical protein